MTSTVTEIPVVATDPRATDDDKDGFNENQGDCDDTNAAIYPNAPEVCNNRDDNCNNQIDDGAGQTLTCGVGACARTVSSCGNGQSQECVPGSPTAEVCENGIDEDCNGSDLTCVTALDITITGPANLASTNQSTIAVTGTVASQATEVTCNGRPAGINTNGFGGNVPLKEGSNIVTCVAKDAAGNVGSASITVSLDSTPPRITIDDACEGEWECVNNKCERQQPSPSCTICDPGNPRELPPPDVILSQPGVCFRRECLTRRDPESAICRGPI